MVGTVDGRNPAKQLKVYCIIDRVLAPSQVVRMSSTNCISSLEPNGFETRYPPPERRGFVRRDVSKLLFCHVSPTSGVGSPNYFLGKINLSILIPTKQVGFVHK